MFVRLISAVVLIPACLGGTCTPELPPPATGECRAALDQATADVVIRQTAGASEATVLAALLHGSCILELDIGQTVQVNGQALSGPDASGNYQATVPTGPGVTSFTVRANEPTRGVSETTVDLPPDFEILSPLPGSVVSLSSIPITWTNTDPSLTVLVTLRQVLQGVETVRTFGPFTDTGGLTVTPVDFGTAFRQGAGLAISVTRIRSRAGINGFRSGTLITELASTVTVTPAP